MLVIRNSLERMKGFTHFQTFKIMKKLILFLLALMFIIEGCASISTHYSTGSQYQTGSYCKQKQVKKTKHASRKQLNKKMATGKW